MDPDPGQPNECESESTTLFITILQFFVVVEAGGPKKINTMTGTGATQRNFAGAMRGTSMINFFVAIPYLEPQCCGTVTGTIGTVLTPLAESKPAP
jgi:hypothetical protein